MKTMLSFFAQFAVTIFAAEFVAGLVHWFEDAYIRERTPLVGRIIGRPNIVHHHYPRFMTRHSWWQSSWDLALFAAMIVVGAWCAGLLTWQVWLFAILAANANEFHKWEHRTRKENGRIISFLQDIRLLQTGRHHALHHTDPKNSHYCTMTNFLNPVLDRIHFWESLEWLLARTVGLKRQPDTSVRGHGPGPAWLKEYQRPVCG
ncbi:MAG TPA: fatty acid desaturase CarF family protein [Verrucomicrobiae bacterium]|nr:fatty acid desaturase CarF family protein [Verrucomicrobiae bacterium]